MHEKAAISAARRVAMEIGCSLGSEVGYSVRFDEINSSETKIKYLTGWSELFLADEGLGQCVEGLSCSSSLQL